MISFSGQANDELAVACTDADELKQAYAETIDRYDADTVDFDVEGGALRDAAANGRRAAAVKALQDQTRADGGKLAVWLTLPVTPDGLQDDALAVVRSMLDARVDLAGVNIMAMDFGWKSASNDMRDAILSAVKATRGQLAVVFAQGGLSLSTRNVWRKLGVTIMIGQNDVAGERVSVEDAEAVAQYALDHGLGRASTWSLNRDQQCGATFAVIGEHSNVCSGVRQKPLAFTRAFAQLRGSVSANAGVVTTRDLLPEASTDATDDPARSPYPIWQPEQAYREGYKVVSAPRRLRRQVVLPGPDAGRPERPRRPEPVAPRRPRPAHRPRPQNPDPAGRHPSEVERRRRLHGRPQGALREACRTRRSGTRRATSPASRAPTEPVAVEAALPHPRRAGAERVDHTRFRIAVEAAFRGKEPCRDGRGPLSATDRSEDRCPFVSAPPSSAAPPPSPLWS